MEPELDPGPDPMAQLAEALGLEEPLPAPPAIQSPGDIAVLLPVAQVPEAVAGGPFTAAWAKRPVFEPEESED